METLPIALGIMLIALVAKIMTMQHIGFMRRQISDVEKIKQENLNELKAVQSQKSIAEKNQKALDVKKGKLEKRVKRIKRELSVLGEGEKKRQKMIKASLVE